MPLSGWKIIPEELNEVVILISLARPRLPVLPSDFDKLFISNNKSSCYNGAGIPRLLLDTGQRRAASDVRKPAQERVGRKRYEACSSSSKPDRVKQAQSRINAG